MNAGLICVESDQAASDFGRLKTAWIVDDGAADETTAGQLLRSWRRSYESDAFSIDDDGWVIDTGPPTPHP
jgi:hypothetical protein